MNLKCIFKGHKMIKDKCIRCLKTECDIKGHDWKYSDIWTRTWNDNSKYKYPKKRKCTKCGITETLLGYNDDWTRI